MIATPPGFEHLGPGLRRVRAPNPSPMTGPGTNTYLLGDTDVAVIDPGPAMPDHMAAILRALPPGARITHILVTHSHLDHSALCRPLAAATGAPVFAYGGSDSGQNPEIARQAALCGTGGGEGIDRDFAPDHRLAEGATVTGSGWQIEAIHTPGHLGNHLCFASGVVCFTGDHVMGWSTSMISPPEGDMAAYMSSLARLAGTAWRIFYPGHGDAISDPAARVAALIAHRRGREADILRHLGCGPATIPHLAQAIYPDLTPALLAAAERNVAAHLIDLMCKNRIFITIPSAPTPTFSLR